LLNIIAVQVREAITRNQAKPHLDPSRQLLGKNSRNDMLTQVSSLLQAYAPSFEQKPENAAPEVSEKLEPEV